MKPSEAVMLVETVQALCPGQKLDQNTWRAWLAVLGDYSFDDCMAAVRTVYREYDRDEFGARRVEADDILRQVRFVRTRRIDAAGDALLPPADLEPYAAIQWRRRATAAAAAGEPIPDNGRRALRGPRTDAERRLAAAGRRALTAKVDTATLTQHN